MSWTWNPLGGFARVASVAALAFARILALEGFIRAAGTGLLYSTSHLRIAYALQFATYGIIPALPFAYPPAVHVIETEVA